MRLPNSTAIFDVLNLLTPCDVTSHTKLRIGGPGDGGYIMFDDFAAGGPVYSFGIGANVSYDEDLASRGRQVYMFDHTILDIPKQHPNFNYSRRGIASTETGEPNTFTLAYYLEEFGHTARNDMLLKIDIEGAEWDILPSILPSDLAKFRQIVIEVHWLLGLDKVEFREKVQRSLQALNGQFVLGHVHANNCAPVGFVEGYACADVLELSYIRADIAQTQPSTSVFPQVLDASNEPTFRDHLLWFYPYLPAIAEAKPAFVDSLATSNRSLAKLKGDKIRQEIASFEAKISALRLELASGDAA